MAIYTITLKNKKTGLEINRDYDETIFANGNIELVMNEMYSILKDEEKEEMPRL